MTAIGNVVRRRGTAVNSSTDLYAAPERHARWVLPLCWTAILLDGFDLVVLGAVLPSLLDYEAWDLNPGSASIISVPSSIARRYASSVFSGTSSD